ncbi:hypothetical protein [Alkalihalobacterium alkalinitrilicum]|uniref:hypothetical protein n=1 Tax=Alkalihalobacterium alkalinitrilicum TaxID=427920 RepID=UPI001302F19C|nr:hypothetical protein [Alkalihalobacterium alkalinitrilicum]
MNQKDILEHIKTSLEKAEFSPEQIFLFRLFNFEFSYDEEKRQCTIECPVSETKENY